MARTSIFQRTQQQTRFTPPENWLSIRTIDLHTGGEPLRVIVDGFPALLGNSVLEYRRDFHDRFDHLRRALMHEPRGHADMYGCLLTPPNDAQGDLGVIFLHNEGYSTMCGHAVIAIGALAAEMGWASPKNSRIELAIDAPCGRIATSIQMEGNRPGRVSFLGVPSFVVGLDLKTAVTGIGEVVFDLAYGGAFYAYVDAGSLELELTPNRYADIIRYGKAIKKAIQESRLPIEHPFEPDLSFLYGVIFTGDPEGPEIDSRNVCVFADGEVDRSPTGSGVMGRMAIHQARGTLQIEETMKIESITGSVFSGSYIQTVDYGPYLAVVPRVEGQAYICGQHEWLIDPEDPFRYGFFLR